MKRGYVIAIIIGLLIIVLLLIMIVLVGEKPTTTGPIATDDCTQVSLDQVQKCCNLWASEKSIAIPMCVGEWKIQGGECAWECGEPVQGCGGVATEQIPICCELWAKENNIIKPACVGTWEVQRGECYWECS